MARGKRVVVIGEMAAAVCEMSESAVICMALADVLAELLERAAVDHGVLGYGARDALFAD
jgi:hypothetical protein